MLPPDLEPVRLAGVPGIRVPPGGGARRCPRWWPPSSAQVPEGEPVYVAPRRSDLVTLTDPLLHFLVDRPNVLRRDALLQARPEEQARIVAALERERPRAVIRWLDPVSSRPEPNERGRPSGSTALDDYLARGLRAAGALRRLRAAGAAMIAVRAAIVVLAVAAIAWLGAGIAASRAQDELRDLVNDTERPDGRADPPRADELRRDGRARHARAAARR